MNMKYEAWPFLVSRNLYVDYRTIVAPDFICNAKISNLLAQSADGDITPENTAYLRKILNSQIGNLTLVFRVFQATKADINQGNITENLKDGFGREIYFIEGLVIRAELESINVSATIFEFIHEQILKEYQKFWNINQPVPAEKSIAFELESESNAKNLKLIDLPPLILKKLSPEIQGKITSIQEKVVYFNKKISSIDFSSDSEFLAIRTESQELYLWDLTNEPPKHLYPLRQFQLPLSFNEQSFESEVAFNPVNSQYIAMGCYSNPQINQPIPLNYVLLFDLSSGQDTKLKYFWQQGVTELIEKCSLKTVAFSPDGSYLASATQQGRLLIWNRQEQDKYDKQEVLNIHNGNPINCLIFTPDSRTVICGVEQDNQGYITLYTIPSHIQSLNYIHCSSLINKLAISPDEKYLAVAGKSGFELWDFATQNRIYYKSCDYPLTAITFNVTGQIIIWGNIQGQLTVFDVQKQIILYQEQNSHDDAITAVVFNPKQSQQFATSSRDKKVRIWELN